MTFFCPNCHQTCSEAEGIQAGYQCPQCHVFMVATSTAPANRAPAAVPASQILATPTSEEAAAEAAAAAAPPPPDSRRTFIPPTDPNDPASRAEAVRANIDLHWQREAEAAAGQGKGRGNGNGAAGRAAPRRPEAPRAGGQSVMVVTPAPDNERDASAMEQILLTFSSLPSTVSLELVGEHGRRRLLVRGDSMSVNFIRKQLLNMYGQIAVESLAPEDDPAEVWSQAHGATQAVRLTASGPAFLPIKTWIEFNGADPLLNLLSPFDQLGEGELALSQLVIHGAAPDGWAKPHLKELVNRKLRGFMGETIPIRKGLLLTLLVIVAGLAVASLLWATVGTWWQTGLGVALALGLGGVGFWLFQHLNDNPWATVLDDEATNKLRDAAFQVDVRLYTLAADMARAKELKGGLVTSYNTFSTNSGNRMQEVGLKDADPRRLPPLAEGDHVPGASYLSVKELAGLWHLPVGVALEQVRRQSYERVLPLPEQVSGHGGCLIGVSEKDGTEVQVYLPEAALQRNLFIIGKTQHGKSNAMEHVAVYWASDPNRALVVVDPHGDMARRVVGLVPRWRAKDVIYIDLSDQTRAVSLNLLDTSGGADPDQIAENFVDVGKALWQKFWGPRMVVPLGFGLRALAHANTNHAPERQYTILALAQLLNADAKQRGAFLNAEVPASVRPDVYNYFSGEYDNTSAHQREQVIAPVLSKAHAFERSTVIKRLVGQPRPTVDLYDALRKRKIIILNCNAGVIGDDMAGFIGSLFINIIRSVIMQQANLPRAERVQVGVIADEFQKLEGVRFGALLGEMQKFGATFLLGTQSLESLRQGEESRGLPEQILANVSTVFALQVNGDDALYLSERELGYKRLSPESLTSIKPYHAYIKTIAADGESIPVFTMRIVPPQRVDPQTAELVRVYQKAYTVDAPRADVAVREALDAFVTLYTRADPNAQKSFGDQTLAAAASEGEAVLARTATPVGGADGPVATPKPSSLRNPHPDLPQVNPAVFEEQGAVQDDRSAGTAAVVGPAPAPRPRAKRSGGGRAPSGASAPANGGTAAPLAPSPTGPQLTQAELNLNPDGPAPEWLADLQGDPNA
jgi:hypothetical protein